MFLLSNSGQLLEEQWGGVSVLRLGRKPLAIRRAVRAFRQQGVMPGEVCVVGDRLLTDVLGANLAGCLSVLVGEYTPSLATHGPRLSAILGLEGLLKRRYFSGENKIGS